MIYLDYAATSLFRENIFKYVYEHLTDFDGNTESVHAFGRSSKKILEEARRGIAASFNAAPKNIYFTSGASEGNNTILHMFKPYELLTTNIEHSSISSNTTNKTTFLSVDKSGVLKLSDLKEKLKDNIKLVSIQYVNNEVGTIQPVIEVGEYLKENRPDIWYHVDAVQAYGHIDIDVEKIKCDSLSVSSHKIGATKGFGVLYSKKHFSPIIIAGDQEEGLRGSTSNVIGAFAMNSAYQDTIKERDYISDLNQYFLNKLSFSHINYEINGESENKSSHIINIYFPDFETDFLLTYLDMHGICVSSGSACKAGSHIPSKVITNMYGEDRANHSIRFSFGYKNTKEELDKVIDILSNIK